MNIQYSKRFSKKWLTGAVGIAEIVLWVFYEKNNLAYIM